MDAIAEPLLEADLDANYQAIKQNPYPWPK